MQSPPTTHPRRVLLYPLFFGLMSLESGLALYRLANIPADPKHSVLLGYSLNRLVMIAVALAAVLIFSLITLQSAQRASWSERWMDRPLRSLRIFTVVMAVLAVLALASWLTLVLLRLDPESALFSAYQRLHPLLSLAFLFGVQGLLVLPAAYCGLDTHFLESQKGLLRATLLAYALLLAVFLLMALTGFGITPDLYAWGPPGVPLLAWQVVLVGLFGCGLFLLARWSRPDEQPRRLNRVDLWLGVALWALAAGLWLSQPVQPSYFNPQVRAPNLEYYPYSDAAYYDVAAQSLTAGFGYMGHRVVSRPLYVLFLALLHSLTGPGYNGVVIGQTLLLALFPVVMFLLGRVFHSRAAGIMMALLAILREINSFAATPLTEVSTSKMLLSDLPTTLVVAVLTLLVWSWLKNPARRWMPLVVGGLLGLLGLLRAQSLLFTPFILLVALWVYQRRWRSGLEAALLMGLGMLLAMVPWMARNDLNGSGLVIDQPNNQTAILAQRYSLEQQDYPARLPGESDSAYSNRMVALARQFALQRPLYTAGFVGAHFLNNEVDTLVVLPTAIRFDDFRNMAVITSLFWDDLFTTLDARQVGLLLFNLLLIAVGLAVCWRKWGVLGLLPLMFNLAYSLSNAVARNSGWRYILPVDWVSYFYFSIGLLTVFAWFLALLSVYRVPVEEREGISFAALPRRQIVQRGAAFGLLFLGLGLAVPLAEVVHPSPPGQARDTIVDEMIANPAVQKSGASLDGLRNLAADPRAVVLQGRALYPRFYYSGQGELGSSGWQAFAVREGARVGFLILDESGMHSIVLPQEKVPAYFPNASVMMVLGCPSNSGLIEAALVVIPGQPDRAYLRNLNKPYSCSIK